MPVTSSPGGAPTLGRPPPGLLVPGIDSRLAELAHLHGVATSFHDWRGGERTVSAAAVTSVLRALGVDAVGVDAEGVDAEGVDAEGVDPDVASAADERHGAASRGMLPVYVVTRAGSSVRLGVHVPHGDHVSVAVQLEDGGRLDLVQQMVWIDPH